MSQLPELNNRIEVGNKHFSALIVDESYGAIPWSIASTKAR
jgi:hypothetical protein